MIDNKFDEFLSKSLKEAELEVDTANNELEQLITQKFAFNRIRYRQRQRLALQIAASVMVLLLIAGAVFFPEPVYAFKKQVFQTIMNIGKSININFNSNAGQVQLQNQIAQGVAAVQESTPFSILAPKHIPSGFQLESVKQSTTDEQACVVMSFNGPDDTTILFIQTGSTDNFSWSVNVDAQEAKVKKVQIDKYEGNLISFEDGSASLVWVTDNHVMCEILGNISPDQAMEMAHSI